MAEKSEKKEAAPRFTAEQLRKSKRYADCRDLLAALLEDGGTYTVREADARIEQFRKGRVS